jgi:hypothetical protein
MAKYLLAAGRKSAVPGDFPNDQQWLGGYFIYHDIRIVA